jgi:hypothetical protein
MKRNKFKLKDNLFMKKLLLLFVVVAIGHSLVLSQGCLPEGITFTTQQQIDNFQADYPGCTEIEGDVMIGSPEGNLNIMNLEGLNGLIKINGFLDINSCLSLGDLSGLDSLTQVAGYVKIQNCTELDNFSGLNSLAYIGGAFEITGNNILTNIQALESLTVIDSSFNLMGNTGLHTLEGLDNLIYIDGSIKIMSNTYLADISALKNIIPDSLKTYVAVISNTLLSDCAIQSICDYLEIPDGFGIFNNNAPGCNNKAEVQAACLTSTEDKRSSRAITFSPNPATSFIILTAPGDVPVEEAIIYNHLGQKVLTAKPVNKTVDVSGLKAGMYMIEERVKDFTGRQKLIKQ